MTAQMKLLEVLKANYFVTFAKYDDDEMIVTWDSYASDEQSYVGKFEDIVEYMYLCVKGEL